MQPLYIDSKCHIKKLKSSRTCLVGYSGFFSREQFFIAWGVDTHTHTRIHPHRSDFKKPGARRPGLITLSVEELGTLLTEVESVINARPLTYVYDDTEGYSYPLCPSHLLCRRSCKHTGGLNKEGEQNTTTL